MRATRRPSRKDIRDERKAPASEGGRYEGCFGGLVEVSKAAAELPFGRLRAGRTRKEERNILARIA